MYRETELWCCIFLCVNLVSVLLATSCPTWHYYNNATGQCECGFGLVCSSDGNQVDIRNDRCATSSRHDGDYYCGACQFKPTINNTNRMYSEMPGNASQLDEVMCGPYNRRGLLCGECKDGYGPAVYSFDQKCAKMLKSLGRIYCPRLSSVCSNNVNFHLFGPVPFEHLLGPPPGICVLLSDKHYDRCS